MAKQNDCHVCFVFWNEVERFDTRLVSLIVSFLSAMGHSVVDAAYSCELCNQELFNLIGIHILLVM